ncbi:uncharacterized protein LOC132945647 [Metopolophium dirhodum]|uniref:uncharacterized protein LOC132945647 n=1 Tax=Metopolophium dirhodum TaxID=44670 RepID=UPI00298F4A7E|nr:uncharacterized protein LOC132945647 [Metopolophium dirhodum]
MISYKTLIALIVLFDITCCFNYRKECRKILKKVGFRHHFPFYNVNFLLQFDNETEYIKHVNRMIKMDCHTKMTLPKKTVDLTLGTQEDLTSTSPEDKKIDTPKNNNENLPEHFSYLIEFYSEISGRNNNCK